MPNSDTRVRTGCIFSHLGGMVIVAGYLSIDLLAMQLHRRNEALESSPESKCRKQSTQHKADPKSAGSVDAIDVYTCTYTGPSATTACFSQESHFCCCFLVKLPLKGTEQSELRYWVRQRKLLVVKICPA
jgi:hypothetical protein